MRFLSHIGIVLNVYISQFRLGLQHQITSASSMSCNTIFLFTLFVAVGYFAAHTAHTQDITDSADLDIQSLIMNLVVQSKGKRAIIKPLVGVCFQT